MSFEEKRIEVIKWVVFLVCLVLGVVVVAIRYDSYQGKRKAELLDFVYLAKAAINPDRVVALKGDRTDLENPDYERLKEQFKWMVDSSKEVRYLYLMSFDISRHSEKMFFLVDSQPNLVNGVKTNPADLAEPGEVYEETTEGMLELYRYGGELVTDEPEADKWGTFISAMVPITERNTGKIIAIVGADFEVGSWVYELNKAIAVEVMILILILVMELVVFNLIKSEKTNKINAGRMVSVLEHSEDAIYTANLNEEILTWNFGAKEIFGYSEEEIVGKKLSILVPSDLLWEKQSNLVVVKQGKSVSHQKTQRMDKGGNLVNVIMNISPIFDKSMTVIGISIIARNIDLEEKERREVEQKNKEMEKLNRVMVGREIKMVELKKRIEELEAKSSGV
ncbi:MAG TPA: PAS domain S-box protein [Candidatus Methanoperedens sp.]|nr:PAS domain S-box protein [Candidatus Methanoperedens sp.]